MGKGICRHIACLSIPKLADRISTHGLTASDTAAVEPWVCTICLHVFTSSAAAIPHSRKHNHQIFFYHTTDESAASVFYCTICGKDIVMDGLTGKQKSLLEDAGKLLIAALKETSRTVLVENGEEKSEGTSPSKQPAIRPAGLVNLGNTCFLNSALQALAAVLLPFDASGEEVCPLGSVGTALLDTLRSMLVDAGTGRTVEKVGKKTTSKRSHRGGPVVDPSAFLGAISKRYKEFRRLRQQDSHDFLRLLFNALDDEHSAVCKSGDKKVASLHQRIFGGTQVSRVLCQACKNCTEVEEAFLDLSLAIPAGLDADGLARRMQSLSTEDIPLAALDGSDELRLEEMLAYWTRSLQLSGENAFACENCPREEDAKHVYRPATLQFSLKKLPPVLIFHLQRFSVSAAGKRGLRLAKDHTHISIPDSLDVSPFLPRGHGNEAMRYSLAALIIHEGSSVDSGHYVAAVRYGRAWWYISDSSVRPISSPAGYNPYLVFYTRE